MRWRNVLQAVAAASITSAAFHGRIVAAIKAVNSPMSQYTLDDGVAVTANITGWLIILLGSVMLLPVSWIAATAQPPRRSIARALLVAISLIQSCRVIVWILSALVRSGRATTSILLGAIIVGVLGVLVRVARMKHIALPDLGWHLLLISSPAALILILQSVPAVSFPVRPARLTLSRPAPVTYQPGRAPVVLVVFDEMDGQLLRQNLDVLPAFQNLSAHSVVATNALPPSTWTLLSLPSYITGNRVVETQPVGNSDLLLQTEQGSEFRSWRDNPNTLFRIAGQYGYRTSLVGYFHPYCEIFEEHLQDCLYMPSHGMSEEAGWEAAIAEWPFVQRIYESEHFNLPLSMKARPDGTAFPRPVWITEEGTVHSVRKHVSSIRNLWSSTDWTTSSTFYFLHLPVPHPPGLRPNGGYLDNFKIANDLLRELVSRLQSAGQFAEATLIVTSDHSLRDFWFDKPFLDPDMTKVLQRGTKLNVPLIVKLPGQTETLEYGQAVDSIVVHDLVSAAIKGELQSPAHAVSLLAARAHRAGAGE